MSADDDHEERREDLWEAEEDVDYDVPELGEGAGWEGVGDRVPEAV